VWGVNRPSSRDLAEWQCCQYLISFVLVSFVEIEQ
jgi:hypothetical protein